MSTQSQSDIGGSELMLASSIDESSVGHGPPPDSASNITLLLTLFGRPLHTLRWMWHHNRAGLEYPILIGDGRPDPVIRRVMADRSLFPRLNYVYREYDDKSYDDYFQKMADLAGRIATPYVMSCDNDDFVGIEGVRRSLAYLQAHPEFSAAGGRVCAFALETAPSPTPLDRLIGKIYTRFLLGSSRAFSFFSAEAADARVLDAINSDFVVHYDVFRSDVLRQTTSEWQALNVQGLLWSEFFTAYGALAIGPVHRDPTHVTYYRQQGTSSGLTSMGHPAALLLAPSWSSDYHAFRNAMVRLMCEQCGAEAGIVAKEFDARTAGFMMRRLRVADRTGMVRRIRGAIMSGLVSLLAPVLPFRKIRLRREWRGILGTLAKAGATPDDLAGLDNEWKSIEATLTGDGFVDFVKANAPELLAEQVA